MSVVSTSEKRKGFNCSININCFISIINKGVNDNEIQDQKISYTQEDKEKCLVNRLDRTGAFESNELASANFNDMVGKDEVIRSSLDVDLFNKTSNTDACKTLNSACQSYLDCKTGEIIDENSLTEHSSNQTTHASVKLTDDDSFKLYDKVIFSKRIKQNHKFDTIDFDLNYNYVCNYNYVLDCMSNDKNTHLSQKMNTHSYQRNDGSMVNIDNYELYKSLTRKLTRKFNGIFQIRQDSLCAFDVKSVEPIMMIKFGIFNGLLMVLRKVNGKVILNEPYSLKLLYATERVTRQNLANTDNYFLRRLEHPNIIKVFENFKNFYDDGSEQDKIITFQLMEYIPYGSLNDFFSSSFEDFGTSQKLRIIKLFTAQILMALDYLHQLEIIYCNLHPDNVVIGNGGYLKIFDFGLATTKDQIREPAPFINMSAYTCLERRLVDSNYRKFHILPSNNAYDERTDIYSFAILLYDMIFSVEIGGYKRPNLTKQDILVGPKRMVELLDDVIDEFKKQSEANNADPALRTTYKNIEKAYHRYDWKNRVYASDLLRDSYYGDVDLPRLLKQESDYLLGELNIDFCDLFIKTHERFIEKSKHLDEYNYFKPEFWLATEN